MQEQSLKNQESLANKEYKFYFSSIELKFVLRDLLEEELVPMAGFVFGSEDLSKFHLISDFTLNGKPIDLSNSPIIVSSIHDFTLSFGSKRVLKGSHEYEIQLPFIPDSLIRLCAVMHEFGHALTLKDVGEEPQQPFELYAYVSQFQESVDPSLIFHILTYANISSDFSEEEKEELARKYAEYFKKKIKWEAHAERSANREMVRILREASEGKGSEEESNRLLRAIQRLVAINHLSRFKDDQPYKQASFPGGNRFDDFFVSEDGQKMKKGVGRHRELNREIIDGQVKPNEADIRRTAINMGKGLSYKLGEERAFKENMVLSDEDLKDGNKLVFHLREGSKLEVIVDNSEFGNKIILLDRDRKHIGGLTLNDGRLVSISFQHGSGSINNLRDFISIRVGNLELSEESIKAATEKVTRILSIFYPREDYLL